MLARTALFLNEGAYLYIRPWCTVVASLLLLLGATSGLRGRTWGVVACSLAGTAFVGAWFAGIAPLYFVAVGLGAWLPTAAALRSLIRFDAIATAGALGCALMAGTFAVVCAGPVLDWFVH